MVYETFRLAAYFAIWAFDAPALYKCEYWLDDINNASAAGWNDVMYHIALDGNCISVRAGFWITSSLVFALFGYCLGQTRVYRNLVLRNGPSVGAALAHIDGGEKLLDSGLKPPCSLEV